MSLTDSRAASQRCLLEVVGLARDPMQPTRGASPKPKKAWRILVAQTKRPPREQWPHEYGSAPSPVRLLRSALLLPLLRCRPRPELLHVRIRCHHVADS